MPILDWIKKKQGRKHQNCCYFFSFADLRSIPKVLTHIIAKQGYTQNVLNLPEKATSWVLQRHPIRLFSYHFLCIFMTKCALGHSKICLTLCYSVHHLVSATFVQIGKIIQKFSVFYFLLYIFSI